MVGLFGFEDCGGCRVRRLHDCYRQCGSSNSGLVLQDAYRLGPSCGTETDDPGISRMPRRCWTPVVRCRRRTNRNSGFHDRRNRGMGTLHREHLYKRFEIAANLGRNRVSKAIVSGPNLFHE